MTNNKFQKEREAWITALFLAGLSKLNKKEYWVGVEEIELTPDTYGVTLRPVEKGNSLDKMNIEVCEWESHSRLDLADHIKKKLKKKKYPGYYILLCYVYNRAGEEVDLEGVYQDIISEEYNISEILLVASVRNAQFDHLIARLYPKRIKIEFNREEEISRLRTQKDIIKAYRGTGKSTTLLGTKEIKFPEC